jgi:triacylglycerol lipase
MPFATFPLSPHAVFQFMPRRIIFLHHGLFGFSGLSIAGIKTRYFAGDIEHILGQGDNVVTATRVHPSASIETRARQLKAQILMRCRAMNCRDARVTIVAHSMGGLDARFMISHLGMDDRVDALITIATPHRGSAYADWAFDNLGTKLRGIAAARALNLDFRAIADLRIGAMKVFNEQTPDKPDVWYGSVATFQKASRIAPFLLIPHGVVTKREGDNDGVVSVKSAVWGDHLATWQTDHLHCVNRRFTPRTLGKSSDVSARYGELLKMIRRNV